MSATGITKENIILEIRNEVRKKPVKKIKHNFL